MVSPGRLLNLTLLLNQLSAGLSPDLLGSLQRSSDLLAGGERIQPRTPPLSVFRASSIGRLNDKMLPICME